MTLVSPSLFTEGPCGVFLQRARDPIDQAVSKCATAALTPILRASQDEVVKSATAARKDNDFVYHERLPDPRSLETILGQAIAKPLPVSFPLTNDFRGTMTIVLLLI